MQELKDYIVQFPAFLNMWRVGLQRTTYRNYYHYLTVEVPASIIRWGSVYKYSSDITETYVHILKKMYPLYSSRSGGKAAHNNPCQQVMSRLGMKSLIFSLGIGNQQLVISNHEADKLNTYLKKQMCLEEDSCYDSGSDGEQLGR